MNYNELQIKIPYVFHITTKFTETDVFISRIELIENYRIRLFSVNDNPIGDILVSDVKCGNRNGSINFKIKEHCFNVFRKCIETYRPEWLY